MAKINFVDLYGRVEKTPVVSTDRDTGEYNYGFFYIDTVRSLRAVGDKLHYIKHDRPMVLSQEPEILDEMVKLEENDIVLIKGVIHTTHLPKTSFCPNCTDESGNATKNQKNGSLVSVTPIHLQKIKSYGDDKLRAVADVVDNREISNRVHIFGTLLADPKLVTTKRGLKITQYPIAINRHYTIRTDDPSIKSDYPFVKSYGEQAIDDKAFLKYQAEVEIDGYLQGRSILRSCTCQNCGTQYRWLDTCMEIIPYTGGVEHISGCFTKDEIEEAQKKTLEDYKTALFNDTQSDVLTADFKSADVE